MLTPDLWIPVTLACIIGLSLVINLRVAACRRAANGDARTAVQGSTTSGFYVISPSTGAPHDDGPNFRAATHVEPAYGRQSLTDNVEGRTTTTVSGLPHVAFRELFKSR